jgi:hypothetical protein
MQHTVRFLGILQRDLQYNPGLSCFLSWNMFHPYFSIRLTVHNDILCSLRILATFILPAGLRPSDSVITSNTGFRLVFLAVLSHSQTNILESTWYVTSRTKDALSLP